MIVFLYCALFLGVACYNNNNDHYNNYHQDNDCAIRSDFECNNGTCISQSRICDGFRDCDRGEDEDRNNCGRKRHSYNYDDNFNRYSDNDRYSNRRFGGSDIFNRYSDNDRYTNRRFGGSDNLNRYSDNDRDSNRRYGGADIFNRYSDNDRYSNLKFGRRDRSLGNSLDNEVGSQGGFESGKRGRNCTLLEITASVDGCDDH